jgi:hypothetical protein
MGDLCNTNCGVTYKIEPDSMLFQALGGQSLNISMEVASYMDSKLQILLNIKMIFGEKHLTKDEGGESKRFSQHIRSMISNIGENRNGLTGSKLPQSNFPKFGGNSDTEQEVLEEKSLSESLEMNQGEYHGHVNVQDEWSRELEAAKKLSMSMMQICSKVSDKISIGAGVTVATLNSSMRKNLMKGVTLATADRGDGSGRR